MNVRTLLNADLAINATTCAVAIMIAEQLFKWRSFTLEAIAFLATWWVLRQAVLFFYSRRGQVQ